MYVIVKMLDDGDNFNIVCDPSTGEPMFFDDALEASEFADRYGFNGPNVDIVDVDPDKLREGLH